MHAICPSYMVLCSCACHVLPAVLLKAPEGKPDGMQLVSDACLSVGVMHMWSISHISSSILLTLAPDWNGKGDWADACHETY